MTLAKADYSWVDTAVKIYQADEQNISGEVLINNYADVEGLSYRMYLLFYDENNKFIGLCDSTPKTIENTITSDGIDAEIPEGTATVKAVVWSDMTKMIPLCEHDLVSKN